MKRLNSDSMNTRSKKQLEQIIQKMDSKNPCDRAEAIKRLGQMNLLIKDLPVTIHSKLEEALFDPVAEVRCETVMALAFLEGKIAIPIIEPLLDDPELSVRSNTIAALSFIGITSQIITKKMMNFLNAPEPEFRDRCARACGRLKIIQSKEMLLELARTDSSPAVRTGAVVGLGLLEDGDPRLKMELRQMLSSETSSPVISAIHETLTLIKIAIARDNLQL